MWQHRVMVSAKRDSRHSTAHAINVFDEVHQYFLHTLNSEEQCLTRLLVPAAHAKKFFVFHTLKAYPCTLSIYLADNLSVFSPGDVIFDAEGERRGVREAVQSMLFYLGEFAVDEQKLSEYKAGNGIRPSPYEICTSRIVYNGPRAERKHETVDSSRIAVSHIDHIIGKDGANLGLLWESFPVTIYLKPISLKEVHICFTALRYHDVKAAEDVIQVQYWKPLLVQVCVFVFPLFP